MICPYCQTENREDRETCYVCGKDISTLRLVVNKARQHYNDALEHAERGRTAEAIEELKNCLDLDRSLINAHVVLGTLYAREGDFAQARECWQEALALQPELQRAHDYLERVDSVQATLPTMHFYRWVAILMFLLSVAMAVAVIYVARKDPAAATLNQATVLMAENRFGEASEKLEQARASARPNSVISTAAVALDQALKLDVDQQVRVIQDLKYRQMFPDALTAITSLEQQSPDAKTRAVLDNIRSDIVYYYHNLIAQLYSAYEQGDVDFATLQGEIQRFIQHYPELPESDEIRSYLNRAERMEIQAAIDNVRRRFLLDNNVETAVEGIRDLARTMGDMPTFKQERQAFIEEILSTLFNMFTGYLDQEDFARASDLLRDIDRINHEFRDVVEVDISGAVDLAWSVLRDARRQYSLKQIEKLIDEGNTDAAEEGIWTVLQEPELSSAELAALRIYWRKINRDAHLDRLLRPDSVDRFLELKISDSRASETLSLLDDFKGVKLARRRRVYLLGLSAASAVKLGLDEQATSLSQQLTRLDDTSTVTQAVNNLVQKHVTHKAPDDHQTTAPQ